MTCWVTSSIYRESTLKSQVESPMKPWSKIQHACSSARKQKSYTSQFWMSLHSSHLQESSTIQTTLTRTFESNSEHLPTTARIARQQRSILLVECTTRHSMHRVVNSRSALMAESKVQSRSNAAQEKRWKAPYSFNVASLQCWFASPPSMPNCLLAHFHLIRMDYRPS